MMKKISFSQSDEVADNFELEPLLEGKLLHALESVTVFTCKLSDLVEVVGHDDFETLSKSLSAVNKGTSRKKVSKEPPTALLFSNRQPVIRGKKVGIYNRVSLISTSPTIMDWDSNNEIQVILILGIVEPETIFRLKNPPVVRFNSDLPKLKLKTVATEFKILSEPFVINEEWGYGPVIEVEVPSGHRFYISPNRSLRDIFENARRIKDSLLPPTIAGNFYRVWKKSDDQRSGFEGLEIERFGNQRARSEVKKVVPKPSKPLRPTGVSRQTLSAQDLPSRTRRRVNGSCKLCQRAIPDYYLVCPDGIRSDACPIFKQ